MRLRDIAFIQQQHFEHFDVSPNEPPTNLFRLPRLT
jgi:hypothetical protein